MVGDFVSVSAARVIMVQKYCVGWIQLKQCLSCMMCWVVNNTLIGLSFSVYMLYSY